MHLYRTAQRAPYIYFCCGSIDVVTNCVRMSPHTRQSGLFCGGSSLSLRCGGLENTLPAASGDDAGEAATWRWPQGNTVGARKLLRRPLDGRSHSYSLPSWDAFMPRRTNQKLHFWTDDEDGPRDLLF